MTLQIKVFAFVFCFTRVVFAETKIPIGMIHDFEDDLTQRSFQEALNALTGHDPTYELITERVNGAEHYQVILAATRLLQKNVLAIVVPSTRDGFSALVALSNNVQIPLISLTDNSAEQDPRMLINVGPNNLRAVLDVMRFYRWSDVVYVYDKDDGRLQHLQNIGSGALKLKVLEKRKLETPELAVGLLRKVENDNPNVIINVLLDVKPNWAAQVLTAHARSPSSSKKNFHFLVFDPVDHDFLSKSVRDSRKLNITVLGAYNPKSPIVEQRLAETRSTSAKEDSKTKALLAYDTADLLDEGFTRLLQNKRDTLVPLPKYYNNTSSKFARGPLVKQFIAETFVQSGLTGPIQLDQIGQRRGMTIYISESTPTEPVDAFTWTDQTGLIVISPAYAMEKNFLSEKKTVIVTTSLASPYMMLIDDSQATGNDRFEGYNKDMIDLIAKDLGIQYELKVVADDRYGSRDSTGKWNGMVGEIINHQADIALADLTITTSRQEAIDFSIPYMTVGIGMLIKKPGGEGNEHGPSASSYFFFYIFTMDVWGCILVSFVGVGVLYFFVTKLTTVYIDSRTGIRRNVGILDSLWFAFGSLLLRNTGIYPKSVSSRLLTAVWWLFVTFIATLYIGGLVSMLLVELFGSGSWNNYKALASKTTYSVIQESLRTGVPEVGCIDGGSTRAFFKHSSTPVYQRLNAVLNENPSYLAKSNKDGLERVKNGGGQYAFLMESSSAEYVSYKNCDVTVVPQQLDSKGYGIGLPKGSQYREPVNRALLKLMEVGELQNLYSKWWISGSPCFKKQERSYLDLYHTSMTLKNVGGLFYCLITGVVLTLFITAIEYCIKRRRRGHHSVALTQISKGESGDLNGDHDIHHSSL